MIWLNEVQDRCASSDKIFFGKSRCCDDFSRWIETSPHCQSGSGGGGSSTPPFSFLAQNLSIFCTWLNASLLFLSAFFFPIGTKLRVFWAFCSLDKIASCSRGQMPQCQIGAIVAPLAHVIDSNESIRTWNPIPSVTKIPLKIFNRRLSIKSCGTLEWENEGKWRLLLEEKSCC